MTVIAINRFFAAGEEPRLSPSGVAASEESLGSGPALLEVPEQRNFYCACCESVQLFYFAWENELGRLGYCVGCGSEAMLHWTRTNGEAA